MYDDTHFFTLCKSLSPKNKTLGANWMLTNRGMVQDTVTHHRIEHYTFSYWNNTFEKYMETATFVYDKTLNEKC